MLSAGLEERALESDEFGGVAHAPQSTIHKTTVDVYSGYDGRMKVEPVLSLESEVSLVKVARALRVARLSRGESQQLAAQRIGVGLSTYQRMESTSGIVGVACGTLLTALSIYGFSASFKPIPTVVSQHQRQRASKSRLSGSPRPHGSVMQ